MGGDRLAARAAAVETLGPELTPVRTPAGDAWILSRDEAAFRAAPGPVAPARLLPSGDAYSCCHGADRDLLVPDAGRREALWTPRVWPGGLLIDGEIAGTWRRADTVLTVQPWWPLSAAERDAVAAEAQSLPLPGIAGRSWSAGTAEPGPAAPISSNGPYRSMTGVKLPSATNLASVIRFSVPPRQRIQHAGKHAR